MPELPEVETTLRGIAPCLQGQVIRRLDVRERRLRWPVEAGLEARVAGQSVQNMTRRGKYILLQLEAGTLLLHLGMSGSFRVITGNVRPDRHDHYDLVAADDCIVRYRDPRRFGALVWCPGDPAKHPLLRSLGVEPMSTAFDGDLLYRLARRRKAPVKSFLMNARVVVGVGNIYASEALFAAGIHPLRKCNQISVSRYQRLAQAVRHILQGAIELGGTTLQDFSGVNGQPGYFEQQLAVYGREGEPCIHCGTPIRKVSLGQRSTFYCLACQR